LCLLFPKRSPASHFPKSTFGTALFPRPFFFFFSPFLPLFFVDSPLLEQCRAPPPCGLAVRRRFTTATARCFREPYSFGVSLSPLSFPPPMTFLFEVLLPVINKPVLRIRPILIDRLRFFFRRQFLVFFFSDRFP